MGWSYLKIHQKKVEGQRSAPPPAAIKFDYLANKTTLYGLLVIDVPTFQTIRCLVPPRPGVPNITRMVSLAAFNPNLLLFVIIGLIVIILASALRYFKQPFVIAYILAGVLLGKHGFKIITDEQLIASLGEIGLILILFFIGMEISIPEFIKKWRVAVFGTTFQILASVLSVGAIGFFFDWPTNQIIVLGFVISLSSSAVIIKLLQDSNESKTQIGENIISILLMQDILIVPMLIATNYLGGQLPSTSEIVLQLIGGLLLIACMVWVLSKKAFSIPFSKAFERDHELQVFFACIICFGFASLTAYFGLSAALGAFVAGMSVHAAQSTEWFHDSLHSFRVIFIALFFISVGMLIDLGFILANWGVISLLLIAVYLTNHLINALGLHYFGRNWINSFYGGALLAQIGELGFVLISSAYSAAIISDFAYQLTIVTIALTLLASPFWIALTKWILGLRASPDLTVTGVKSP